MNLTDETILIHCGDNCLGKFTNGSKLLKEQRKNFVDDVRSGQLLALTC